MMDNAAGMVNVVGAHPHEYAALLDLEFLELDRPPDPRAEWSRG